MSEKQPCSAEEIEKKRLAAIERLKSRKDLNAVQKTIEENRQKAIARRNLQNKQTKNEEKPKIPPAPAKIPAVSINIELKTFNTFQVYVKGFSIKLFSVFRELPTYRYDKSAKSNTFSITDYKNLLSKLFEMKSEVTIEKQIPQFVINILQAQIDQENPDWLNAIEPSLINSLNHSQKEAVLFGIARRGKVLLGDDMGLGKTRQALAIADFYRDNFPLLIVTNKSTRQFWATEIRKLLPIAVHYIHVVESSNDVIDEAKIVIANYPLNKNLIGKLIQRSFGVIIFDESHNLKNQKSDTAKLASKVAEKAVRIILISGTPALSRPCELYQQLYLLDRKNLNWLDYIRRYCAAIQTQFGWNDKGKSNLDELTILLNHRFMIRRTKDEMALNFLPDKHVHLINLKLDSTTLETNDESIKDLQTSFQNSSGVDRENVLVQFYSITAKLKKNVVCQYLENFLENPNKMLVFAHHTVMMDAICEFYKSKRIEFIRIDGSTNGSLREEYIDRFQRNSKCRVAVLSIRSCNAGITLTAASLVIFAELDWTPSTMEQAMCRAHRIGQTQEVNVYYLIASNTADDLIWGHLQGKVKTLNEIGFTKPEKPTVSTKMEVNEAKVAGFGVSSQSDDEFLMAVDIPTTSGCFKDTKDQDKENNNAPTQPTDFYDENDDELLMNLDY